MDDKEILLAIQELLDGTQWCTETVDQISTTIVPMPSMIHQRDP